MITCIKCSREIPEDSTYCMHCGAKIKIDRTHGTKKRGNGQGCVYKRGNKWQAIVTTHYTPDGKRHSVSKTFTKKSDAINYIPILKAAADHPAALPVTLRECFDKVMARSNVTKYTMQSYVSNFKHFDSVAGMRISDIKTAHLQDCIDAMPTATMQIACKSLAHMCYDYAIENDIVDKNYAEYIRCKPQTHKERNYYTKDEVRKVIEAVGRVDYAEHITALMLTGFRPNELFSLTKDNVNIDEGYITGGSKTDAGRNRIVPIHPILMPILRDKINNGKEFLFPSVTGDKIRVAHFATKPYRRACSEIGIPVYTPYACRHTFATLIKDSPLPDIDKSRLMGHTQYQMTTRYTHTDVARLSDIVKSIDVENSVENRDE